MKKISLIGCLLIISTLVALYGVNIAAGGTVTQDFDGIGTSATATMPTGWKVDKNKTVRSGFLFRSCNSNRTKCRQ